MRPTNAFPPYRLAIKTADELKKGYDPGLDIICNGILRGDPFVYPAEPKTGDVPANNY
jgi:hypothetical protein